MDTQSEETERVWRVAEAFDQEVDFLEQELERAEALLKLSPEKEGSLDSVSEWENSDSELSDQDDLNWMYMLFEDADQCYHCSVLSLFYDYLIPLVNNKPWENQWKV